MTPFFLLSGAGNDFLALAEPERVPAREEIHAWCRRGLSIGADGLFILRRGTAPSSETPPSVGMEYFNADGRAADLCLNGTRCAARLAFALGWAQRRVCIETGAGLVHAHEIDSTEVRLEEAPLPTAQPEEIAIQLPCGELRGFKILIGVPHLVLEVADVATAPVESLGPRLRAHDVFAPAGTNVDFVETVGRSLLLLRTWERGVEAETLACGTGVLAAVAVGIHTRRLVLPVTVRTRGGFELEVAGTGSASGIQQWSLSGDARLLARGEIFSEATAIPPPTASVKLPRR